jgi:hypothetical protein
MRTVLHALHAIVLAGLALLLALAPEIGRYLDSRDELDTIQVDVRKGKILFLNADAVRGELRSTRGKVRQLDEIFEERGLWELYTENPDHPCFRGGTERVLGELHR